MAEVADEPPLGAAVAEARRPPGKKRWRAWVRAIHRDVGYLAIGFTIIYAISGIAMNHLEDWDPNFRASERTVAIQPIEDEATNDEAVARVAAAVGRPAPADVFRAGDEVHLTYEDGTKVTAIGATVTIQERTSRFFLRVANWLHAARAKAGWKYIADAYAVLLLYLAISGLFMLKGRLGLRWRGTILASAGFAVPLAYIVLTGGPAANELPGAPVTAPADEDTGIRLLTPEENAAP